MPALLRTDRFIRDWVKHPNKQNAQKNERFPHSLETDIVEMLRTTRGRGVLSLYWSDWGCGESKRQNRNNPGPTGQTYIVSGGLLAGLGVSRTVYMRKDYCKEGASHSSDIRDLGLLGWGSLWPMKSDSDL